MLAVLNFNAADEMAASARRRAVMIAIVDAHGGCCSILLITLRLATSRVAADLKSTIRKGGGYSW